MGYWKLLKKQWIAFLCLGAVSATYAIGQSILPYFIKHILNRLYEHSPQATNLIIKNTAGLIFFWISSSVAVIVQGKLLSRELPLLKKNVAFLAIEYLQCVHHAVIAKISAGALSRQISDLTLATEKITHFVFVNIINTAVVLILTLGLLFTVSHGFFILLLAWVWLHAYNTSIYLRTGSESSKISAEASSVLSGKMVDLFLNVKAVHVFGNQSYERDYLNKYLTNEETAHRDVLMHLEKMKIRQSLLSAGFILCTVVTLVILQLHHKISLGDFSMVLLLVFNVANVVWSITFQLISVAKDIGIFQLSVKNIFEIGPINEKIDKGEMIKLDMPAKIEFQKLSFCYQGSKYLFKDLSFTVAPGEKIALSAPSGKGKTTLINLLLGLNNPSAGKVLINGKELSRFSSSIQKKLISYVPQETLFFNRSIFENVQYGNVRASKEKVIEVCKLAQCHEFIMNLKDGYETSMGERGKYLSGGQLQRLAIARALLKKSPIVILDEPTSSLDEANSQLIEELILEVSKKATLILISHKVSTLRCVDRIIQINNV